MLKLFNCNVRLGGNVLSDVPKQGVTEMEIRVLQAIHGSDSVILIKSAGEADRSDADEASRLAGIYAKSVVSDVAGIQNIPPLLIDEGDDQPETVAPAVEAVAEQATSEAAGSGAKTKAALE